MRRRLAATVVLVLAGCAAGCSTPEEPGRPTQGPTVEPVAARVIALLTAVDSGGSTGLVATRLDLPGATASYALQFRRPLRTRVENTAAGVAAGRGEVYAQVVSLDCDVPATVQVSRRNGQIVIAPVVGPDPPVQDCAQPITTVAIVTVPDP